MLSRVLGTARDLGRLQEIASVLIQHGFGDLVRRAGAARLLERAGRVLRWKSVGDLERQPEVRVREALEQLGPTFIKLGQLLAGRPDLLPPSWVEEMSKLQQHVEPLTYEEVREQLVEDLGADPQDVFTEFDTEPLAAASIAQVHRAQLPGGIQVVLKLRRPGIQDVVEADLRLMARLAGQIEEFMPELRRLRPRSLVRQFSRSMRTELDLRIEARNTSRLRRLLPMDSGIVIPEVHGAWTTERLCVFDFLEGPSVGDWIRNGMRGSDPVRIAALGTDAMLRMVFLDGVFHADPHPGNMIVLPSGELGLIDFGQVGILAESRRIEFLGLLMAVVAQDVDEVVGILSGWSEKAIPSDSLPQECAEFIDRYHGLPLGEIDGAEILGDLLRLLRENGLVLPTDVAMLIKVFLTLDDLGRNLDPDFVLTTHVEPFARRAWRQQHSIRTILSNGAEDLGSVLSSLPRDLRHLATWARHGRLHIDVGLDQLDSFGQKLDQSANRLTVGLITAALIIGTSISLTVPGGVQIFGFPLFGFVAFTSSIATGVFLLWTILKSGGG